MKRANCHANAMVSPLESELVGARVVENRKTWVCLIDNDSVRTVSDGEVLRAGLQGEHPDEVDRSAVLAQLDHCKVFSSFP